MMIPMSFWIAAAVIVVFSVITDVTTAKIPNIITLGGILVGLVIHLAAGFIDAGILGALREGGLSIGGMLACGILPYVFWRIGALGGGDVKLFAALGALLGPMVAVDVQIVTFALSLVLLVPYRLVRYGIRKNFFPDPKLPRSMQKPIILAPTIGLAFAVAVFRYGAFL